MIVAVEAKVLTSFKDSLTFTCATIAVAEQAVTDRPASAESVARAVPFTRIDAPALPPSYFRLLHQVQNVRRRQVAS